MGKHKKRKNEDEELFSLFKKFTKKMKKRHRTPTTSESDTENNAEAPQGSFNGLKLNIKMLILLLIVSVSAGEMDPFIVGGQMASIKDWPFIAYIEAFQNGPTVTTCGGSLLSSQTVLTAAHCLDDVTQKKTVKTTFSIFMGNSRYDKAIMTRKVLDYETHNDYSPEDMEVQHDIGVMFLSSPVKFSQYVKKVVLQRSFSYNRDRHLAVAGWGAVNAAGHGTKKLKSLDLRPKAYPECKKMIKVICTTMNDNKYAFSGDSGGPMVNAKTYHQLGLVSFRYPQNGMTVFTHVPKYRDWIKKTQLKMFKKNCGK